MKKVFKKSLAFILALTMVFGAAPLAGLVGLELPSIGELIAPKAEAATYGVLTYEINDGEVTITGCDTSASGELVIPDTIEGCPVTTIGFSAFYECISIESVTLPNSIESVEYEAFKYCKSLTSISIPNSGIKWIDGNAFEGTAYYNNDENWVGKVLYIENCLIKAKEDISGEYTVRNNTAVIANDAFYNCKGLKNVILSNSVTTIGNNAFYHCISLTNISIPNSVEEIGHSAFYGCLNLKKISIGCGIKSIGESAFRETGYYINEDNWTDNVLYIDNCLIEANGDISGEYIVKNNTTVIADYAFFFLKSITGVTIPASVTNIGDSAFEWCSNLASVTIPNGVVSIGTHAFEGCDSLTNIALPNSVMSIGAYAFEHCSNLTSITIPASVINIGNNAFESCKKLESISVDKNNQNYSNDEYGALFNKEKTKLIQYPEGNTAKEYTIPDSVTSINGYAFYECNNLTSVTIPTSVISIGTGAFAQCKSLTNVTIPNSVTSISHSMFYGCTSLTSVTIPDSITVISDDAFNNCYNLTSITIPNSVMSIGAYAFANCSDLINVTISDSVTSIDVGAFAYCESLTNVTIPNSVTSISHSMFYGCTSLTSVTIPDSVTSIGSSAFSGCAGLTNITIPDSVKSIGSNAFGTCISLIKIKIPDSVEEIGHSAFYGCLNLKTISIGKGIKSIELNAFEETGFFINEDNWVDNVLYIDNCLIKAKRIISGEYTVKDGTIIIADDAFSNCNSLTNITLPNSVKNIGSSAFRSCYKLTIDTFPSGLASIGICAFYECINLKINSFPNELTNIGASAFENCSNLTSVTIPASVTGIGSYAFRNCNKLENITVDENNQHYSCDEYGALFDKNKVELIQYPIGNTGKEYTIPDGVTIVDSYAFEKCYNLTSVTIPDSVTGIGGSAFEYCSNLTTVTIPASVTGIGSHAFRNCNNLESITVDENNRYYSSDGFGVLFNKNKTNLIQYPAGNTTTKYTISDSVTSIGDDAFKNCYNLTSVTIPNSVTSIDDRAFYYCDNLTSVIIPDSVTNIGWTAFYGCSSLMNVTIPASVIDIGHQAFDYCEKIEYFEVDKNNPNYSNDNFGALFNKDKTELIQYPAGNPRNNYTIPDTVTRVDGFTCSYNLKSVTIPKSVSSIDSYAFSSCDNLNTVYYSGSPSMWNKISINSGNDKLKNATIIYAEEDSESGETVETKKETVSDEATDVSVEYISNFHEGEVGLEVERTFDGKAFDVISTQLDINSNEIYDIKMTVDGVVTQPNGKVKVKIPIPAGYDPAKTFVYHVNTNSGTVENMNAVVEGNYLVFETDHFSYYAVVEVKGGIEDPGILYIRTPSTTNISYGDSIILHLDIDRPLPDGAYIEWSESNGNFDMSVSADGLTCKISPKSNGKTVFTATVYDKDGNVISSDTQEMTAKAGLWQKIVAFFKKIFGLTKTIPEAFKGIF
ncbi:MAG: leucine-rich repeat domain-containing protein [Acutalibacteraceae bacterium]